MAGKILFIFAAIEFAIGVAVTLWFTIEKIVFPAISFIVEITSSYEEFKEWRKRNG